MRKRIPLVAGLGLVVLLLLASLVFVQEGLLAKPAERAQRSVSVAPAVQPIEPIADDTFAAVDLSAGFLLDPYLLRVIGGGDTAASELDDACSGYVSDAPNVEVNWSGDGDALHVFVYSDMDPVLVVETPEGDYLCNDDANEIVVDPLVTVEDPAEGSYKIYVGSFSQEEPVLGFLALTELDVYDDLAAMDLSMLLDRREYAVEEQRRSDIDLSDLALAIRGVFGDDELSAGFETIERRAAGGGDLAVASFDGLAADCLGYVSLVPTSSFAWDGSGSLSAYFESEENATLIVVAPEGQIHCNDNAADDNLNPVIDIVDAPEGNYDVYIGSHVPGAIVRGLLVLTGDTSAEPTELAPGS